MRYLSLFSGIEAATVAWEQLGWECAAVSEILEYQSAVISHHYPNIKNFGDVTKITDDDIKSLGKLDVVIFGSPCSDMSVAGNRGGLETIKDDTNHSSILFYEGMRVFELAKKYCGARFLVWENVPGALNSNNGEDFGKIIERMVGVKCHTRGSVWRNEGLCCGNDSLLEWSVLDAKWFGVAQRRRRLFIVLDTGNWKSRSPILLESKSLRGDYPPFKEEKKIASYKTKNSIIKSSTNKLDIFFDDYDGELDDEINENSRCFDMQAFGEYGTSDIASTIKGRDYIDATDLIVDDYVCAVVSNIIGRSADCGGNGTGYNEEVMYTLTGADHHAIAYSEDNNMCVRRLTPLECERLQGFPGNFTNINNATFAKRINALGRSMAVPVIKWIGKKIESVYTE